MHALIRLQKATEKKFDTFSVDSWDIFALKKSTLSMPNAVIFLQPDFPRICDITCITYLHKRTPPNALYFTAEPSGAPCLFGTRH